MNSETRPPCPGDRATTETAAAAKHLGVRAAHGSAAVHAHARSGGQPDRGAER